MFGCACRSPAIPTGVIKPSGIARLGSPPGEILTWTMVPSMRPPVTVPTLNVVIQGEFVRMRPQPHRVGFILALVIDERLDQFFGENVALQQESVVVFQTAQRLVKRSRHGWYGLHFFRREIVDVLVERLPRPNPVGHAI